MAQTQEGGDRVTDLITFLLARLDEDEDAAHMAEAVRAILTEYAPVARNDDGSHEPEYAYGWADALGMAVRALAASYRDHPDYDPAWDPA
jgi:hypothetical protein